MTYRHDHLLRAVRRGAPPPGSCCFSNEFGAGVVVRLPDGTGWGCSRALAEAERGWSWDNWTNLLTHAVAIGLSDERCRAVIAAVADASYATGRADLMASAGRAAALRALGLDRRPS